MPNKTCPADNRYKQNMYVKLGSTKVTAITDSGLSFREGAYDRHMRPTFAIEVFGPCTLFASKY